MYFVISDDAVLLTADTDRDPDFAICGTLLTLARVAAGSGQQAIRDGSLELIGDVDKAQAFQTLLAHAKPDIEEELSTFVGDSAAHGIGQAVRSVRSWASNARTTLGENIREYLQEESADVPSRYEFETFSRRLSTLRDDVDRLAARIDRRKDA
jgi:ubiquinone biosynthesis protein UbiJ